MSEFTRGDIAELKNATIGKVEGGFNLAKPAQSLQLASVLQKFVRENNLTSKIQGKDYALVEAWQFAGSQLGLVPVIQSIVNVSGSNVMTGDAEIKYMATVDIVSLETGRTMSRGIAICSNKEYSKKKFDEYAIASMAQTRAIGKGFRNLLGWLMKAAGVEATPAEEMDFARHEEELKNMVSEGERKLLRDLAYNSDLNQEEITAALTAIEFCTDYKRYEQIQHRLESRQKPFDQIPNPNQGDINTQIKKIAGNGK